jgi:hypothetical protein
MLNKILDEKNMFNVNIYDFYLFTEVGNSFVCKRLSDIIQTIIHSMERSFGPFLNTSFSFYDKFFVFFSHLKRSGYKFA